MPTNLKLNSKVYFQHPFLCYFTIQKIKHIPCPLNIFSLTASGAKDSKAARAAATAMGVNDCPGSWKVIIISWQF